MFTDECSYTKCFYYICIVNDLLYEKRKIKEMKVKKKKKKKKKITPIIILWGFFQTIKGS